MSIRATETESEKLDGGSLCEAETADGEDVLSARRRKSPIYYQPDIYDPFKRDHTLRLTERDVQACFEATPPVPRFEKTKQTVVDINENYVSNLKWWKDGLIGSFPIVNTIRTYKKEYIIPDLAAGVACGISAIPIGEH